MSALRLWTVALSVALGLLVVVCVEPAGADGCCDPVPACAPAQPACAPCAACCYEPRIRYVAHRLCRRVCCCCAPEPRQTILQVQDPGSCCCRLVDVPICLPGCCDDAPCVRSRGGLFCRGVVTYTWCCGYTVRVVFHHRGDITVHTYGS